MAECEGCKSKDVFIDYLINEKDKLQAQLDKYQEPQQQMERHFNNVKELSLGYKSVRQRIRSAILAQKAKLEVNPEEDKYEKVEVNDSTN